MTIYNIFDYAEIAETAKSMQPDLFSQSYEDYLLSQGKAAVSQKEKGRFFSALAARVFFFLLLVADLVWSLYAISMVLIKSTLYFLTFLRLESMKEGIKFSWLSFKRSLVCAIALFVAMFAPALGIMFSCMYFLMYDKEGVNEVVPASLREQFKDFLPTDWF